MVSRSYLQCLGNLCGKMHIDGIQLTEKADGHKIIVDKRGGDATEIQNHNFRELLKMDSRE